MNYHLGWISFSQPFKPMGEYLAVVKQMSSQMMQIFVCVGKKKKFEYLQIAIRKF